MYLDSSAYLAVLLREPAGGRVAKETEGAELVSSVLLLAEAHRTVARLGRERRLETLDVPRVLAQIESDIEQIILRDVTADLASAQPFPSVSLPRTLDLIHLRTALWFHGRSPLSRFLTLDERQAASARELGLPG